MEDQARNKRKAALIEISAYTVLFVISLLFPICTFYYLGKDDSMITKPQYIQDFGIAYLFPLFYAMVLCAFFSSRKGMVITINILVLVFAALLFLVVQLSFAWWGVSPFHPDLGTGYWLSHLVILLLIVRTFTWSGRLHEMRFSKSVRTTALVLSVLIPAGLVAFLAGAYYINKNTPVMRSEWTREERGRLVREESWDYTEAYGAYADKYLSKSKEKKAGEKFQLDSVRFTYFENLRIVKEFTRKAEHGKLDIEAVLDDN